MFEIITPATSANMGSGFDCIGMAFQLYNTLWVEESDEKFLIDIRQSIANDDEYKSIPTDETNLIYSTMCDFYAAIHQSMPGVHLIQSDQIPLTRGLGSSAACIVAGLLAANALSGANLDRHELVQMAAALEGHPDNVAPAILGGVVVGAMSGKHLDYCRFPMPAQLRFALLIPNFQFPTSLSRKALPDMVTREDAVFNASRAALLTAALQMERFDLLKIAMQDRLHQPYRMALIPGMKELFEECERKGAYSVFLSGAGPTLTAVTDNVDFHPSLPEGWELRVLTPDENGARVRQPTADS